MSIFSASIRRRVETNNSELYRRDKFIEGGAKTERCKTIRVATLEASEAPMRDAALKWANKLMDFRMDEIKYKI